METNDVLRKQLEAQEEETRRIKTRFVLENKQLKDQLVSLSTELAALQLRLRENAPLRQASPLPLSSPAHSGEGATPHVRSGAASPSPQGGEERIVQGGTDVGVQCELLSEVTLQSPPMNVSDATRSGVKDEIEENKRRLEDRGQLTGLVSSPIGRLPTSLEDSDVPSLAREADRLLGVITRLRTERNTPQPNRPPLS